MFFEELCWEYNERATCLVRLRRQSHSTCRPQRWTECGSRRNRSEVEVSLHLQRHRGFRRESFGSRPSDFRFRSDWTSEAKSLIVCQLPETQRPVHEGRIVAFTRLDSLSWHQQTLSSWQRQFADEYRQHGVESFSKYVEECKRVNVHLSQLLFGGREGIC